MELIKFDDSCIIERKGGNDKYDNPIVEVIFEGGCLYQEDSTFTAQGMVVNRASLFIKGEVGAKINDFVNIRTKQIDEIATVVEDVDILTLPITGNTITRLSLKQGLM